MKIDRVVLDLFERVGRVLGDRKVVGDVGHPVILRMAGTAVASVRNWDHLPE